MLPRILLIIFISLLIGCDQHEPTSPAVKSSVPQKADFATASKHVTAANILADVTHLSKDTYEGRGTGTTGERAAAEWIASRYKESGLVPLGGEDYLQAVELIGFKKDASSTLSLKGPKGEIPYENDKTLTYWSTSQKSEVTLSNTPFLFVGYGVEAPEHNWDDFKGVDCKGKILIFLNNDPQTGVAQEFGGEARTYYGRYSYKFEQAVAKGAAGAVMIHTTPSAGYGWQVIGKSGAHESFALNLEGAGYQLDFLAWMHEDLAAVLAATVGDTLAGWEEKGKRRDFQPQALPVSLNCKMKVALRETSSQNVVGLWEGSDPILKQEILVFTAHYDHLGILESGEGDLIYNGAWDNALGVSCIMEVAAAFGKSKLRARRSIAFIACTAEEKGLLGSQWFVAKPPVPRNKLVGNINIDMPQIFGLTKDIGVIGHDSNSMGDAIGALAAEWGVEVKGDQDPNAGRFYRSDQVSFAKAGIPALYLLPGKDYRTGPTSDPEDYRTQHYHQLSDQVNEFWDLSGCERDMRLVFQLVADLAMATEQPRWHAGNEFEVAWKQLYGKD